ncbi:hypothetical protein LIER_07389 [Lithospermum erythrorhizon]|uniref:Histidine-containing phosphotransfer protein n=1 Tax=Lithospermum erythrorhizon TaxID=34254 RepID=A0AAV3P8D5_LITER
MDLIGQLQKQYVDFVTSLYHEGFLDDQFLELQKLRDDSNPSFVAEVVSLFFDDSENLINNLAKAFHQHVVDYKLVDAHVHQFKGSSSSIGANKVKNACVDFKNSCDQKNIQGCLTCLQNVKREYYFVKSKLETLFRLEQQIMAAGGAVPMLA